MSIAGVSVSASLQLTLMPSTPCNTNCSMFSTCFCASSSLGVRQSDVDFHPELFAQFRRRVLRAHPGGLKNRIGLAFGYQGKRSRTSVFFAGPGALDRFDFFCRSRRRTSRPDRRRPRMFEGVFSFIIWWVSSCRDSFAIGRRAPCAFRANAVHAVQQHRQHDHRADDDLAVVLVNVRG